MHLTWFDAVMAGVLIIATMRGAAKGLVWQLAWIAAILLSFAFCEVASIAIAGAIPLDPPLNRWVAMFALHRAEPRARRLRIASDMLSREPQGPPMNAWCHGAPGIAPA